MGAVGVRFFVQIILMIVDNNSKTEMRSEDIYDV